MIEVTYLKRIITSVPKSFPEYDVNLKQTMLINPSMVMFAATKQAWVRTIDEDNREGDYTLSKVVDLTFGTGLVVTTLYTDELVFRLKKDNALSLTVMEQQMYEGNSGIEMEKCYGFNDAMLSSNGCKVVHRS